MKQKLEFTFEHVKESHAITERLAEYSKELEVIAMQRSGVYAEGAHALRLANDPSVLADVTHMIQRYWNTQLRYVIVIGIGGSNLGAKAVYDAVRGTLDGNLDGYPKMIFIDTVSTKLLDDLIRLLEIDISYPEEIVVSLVSKSGSTTESIANFEILFAYLQKRFPKISERVVVTTDKESILWNKAESHGFGLLVHQKVGGRFSVFSSVGLFPLGLVGLDVKSFVEGGKDLLDESFGAQDQAIRFAEVLFRAKEHGASIFNVFLFNPELESFGKWMRQLYAESLGKEKDKSGKTVHEGITPIVSIGSTDLHSMGQLYLGGPRDKFTLFMHAKDANSLQVPERTILSGIVHHIEQKSLATLMNAIFDGVKTAFTKNKLAHGEVVTPPISLYTLGILMQWQILAVLYLAELMHVNAFDQPNVEDYKVVTRRLLES